MKKRVLATIICVMMVIQTCFMNVSFAQGADSGTTQKVIDLKAEGLDQANQFSKLLMMYSVIDNNHITTQYNIDVDDDYLNQYRQEIDEIIDESELPDREDYDSDEVYNEAVKEFYDNYYLKLDDAMLPKIQISLPFNEEYFDLVNGNKESSLTIPTGEVIGEYILNKSDTGEILLTCVFSKKVYNLSDVKVSFSLEFVMKKTLKETETVEVVWDKEKSIFTVNVIKPYDDYQEDEAEYTLKKSAAKSVTTPYIDYTITTSVKNGYLNGKTVVDVIPEGLYVQSVTLDGVAVSDSAYTISEGQFNYTFPKLLEDKSNAVDQAKFEIRMYLNAESYKGFMQYGVHKVFINEAYLKDLETDEELTVPTSIGTQMDITFLEKDGKQVDAYGIRFSWDISVNSYFPQPVNAYIVDTIDASLHTYDVEKGVDIYENDLRIGTVNPVKISANVPYESLTVEDLEHLTAVTGAAIEKQSIYYTYKDSEDKERSVLVIPYNNYVNSKVLLKYFTDLVLPEGVTKDEYSGNDKLEFTNQVKMVWEFIPLGDGSESESEPDSGAGEGIKPDFIIEIAKRLNSKLRFVEKSKGSFDNSTHELTWIVNVLGADLSNAGFTDTIGNDIQELPKDILDGTGTISAVYKNGNVSSSIEIPSESNRVEGNPYYYVQNGETPGTYDLTIYIGELSRKESYSVIIRTLIADKDFFTKPVSKTLVNTVKSFGSRDGVEYGNEAVAMNTITSLPLNKVGVQQVFTNLNDQDKKTNYDYKNHTTKWKTVVNSNNLQLSDIRLEETLPIGSNFEKLSSITIYNNDNTVQYQLVSEDGVHFEDELNESKITAIHEDGKWSLALSNGQVITWEETKGTEQIANTEKYVPNNTVTISLSDEIDYKFEYEMYASFDETYRKELLANYTADARATVKLDATYEGNDAITTSKSATLKISPIVLEKKGVYNKEQGTVTWTMYVNQDQVDLGGYSLVESLKSMFDADFNTLRVHRFDVTSLGEKIILDDLTDSIMQQFAMDETQGFVFTIPEEYKNTPLCFQFDTEIVEDVKAVDVTNQVALTNGEVQYRKTAEIRPDNMVDFNLEEFAMASSLASVFVTKVSSNKDALGTNQILLKDAKFELVAMKYDGTKWVEDKSSYYKSRISTEKGRATFFNLQRGVLYKLKELKAPDGYVMTSADEYIVFVNEDESMPINYPSNTIKMLPDSKIYKETIENDPNGSFSFIKVGPENESVMGAKFKLSRVDGMISDKLATSSNLGRVVFNQLDPGEYVLSEVEAPTGYLPIDDLNVTIEYNEDGTLRPIVAQNACVSVDSKDNIVICDESDPTKKPEFGTLRIIKDSEDGKKEGFTFEITGPENHGKKFKQVYDTDATGTIVVSGLTAGIYRIKELVTDTSKGYIIPKIVYVVVDGNVVTVSYYNELKHKAGANNKRDNDPIVDPISAITGPNGK